MRGLAVLDTPAMPDGWEGREVARIVDPLGTGVAWIDPRRAGLCVGFFARARRSEAWIPVLESAPPDRIDQPGAAGGELVWALPGRGAAPARSAGSWALMTRDPTAVIVAGSVEGISIRLSSAFVDGALVLAADAAPGSPGAGRAGFRLNLRDVDIVRCEGPRIDAVGDRLPAGVLRCAGSPDLRARWTRPVGDDRLACLEWLPTPRPRKRRSGDRMSVSLTMITA